MFPLTALPFSLLLTLATAAQLSPRGICNASAAWEVTPTAYLAADTDTKLRDWWAGVSGRQHSSFTTELGRAFGSHVPYQCGLTDDSACIYAGCSGTFLLHHYLPLYNRKVSNANQTLVDFEDRADPI